MNKSKIVKSDTHAIMQIQLLALENSIQKFLLLITSSDFGYYYVALVYITYHTLT
jgi:hypothetical protein